jgi:hypothetical protein
MATKIRMKSSTLFAFVALATLVIGAARAGTLYVANHMQDYDYISQFAVNRAEIKVSGTFIYSVTLS